MCQPVDPRCWCADSRQLLAFIMSSCCHPQTGVILSHNLCLCHRRPASHDYRPTFRPPRHFNLETPVRYGCTLTSQLKSQIIKYSFNGTLYFGMFTFKNSTTTLHQDYILHVWETDTYALSLGFLKSGIKGRQYVLIVFVP